MAPLEELKYQLLLIMDLGLINSNEFKKANDLAEEVSKMLFFWVKAIKSKAN